MVLQACQMLNVFNIFQKRLITPKNTLRNNHPNELKKCIFQMYAIHHVQVNQFNIKFIDTTEELILMTIDSLFSIFFPINNVFIRLQ